MYLVCKSMTCVKVFLLHVGHGAVSQDHPVIGEGLLINWYNIFPDSTFVLKSKFSLAHSSHITYAVLRLAVAFIWHPQFLLLFCFFLWQILSPGVGLSDNQTPVTNQTPRAGASLHCHSLLYPVRVALMSLSMFFRSLLNSEWIMTWTL